MATARGTRDVAVGRELVWEALSRLTPYCSVCDVSYVFDEPAAGARQALGLGRRFVCAPGRLDVGAEPPPDAVAGEIVEWSDQRCIGTRLVRATETWHTRIEIDEVDEDATRVAITVTHEPTGGSRLLDRLRTRTMQRIVQRTVDSELAKLPGHIALTHPATVADEPVAGDHTGVIVVEREATGSVLHLRGEVDAAAVRRFGLARRLEEEAVVAIDVTGLTYLDSAALPPLRRWARAASGAGRSATARGVNQEFDRVIGVMGMTSVFRRED